MASTIIAMASGSMLPVARCGVIDESLIDQCRKAWVCRSKLSDARLRIDYTRSSRSGQRLTTYKGLVLAGAKSLRVESPEKVVVYNPGYAFRIRRAPDKPASLIYLGQRSPEFDQSLVSIHHLAGGCFLPWSIAGKMYEDWEKTLGFAQQSFRLEEFKGKRLAVIRFSYQPTESSLRKRQKSVVCRFDPENLYCVHSSEIVDRGGRILTDYQYHEPVSGLPRLHRFIQDYAFKGGGTMHDETVFEWSYEKREPDTSQFLLSAFGFPEPLPPAPPPQSWLWLWLLGGSVALGAASLWLWRRSHASARG